jgi:hypothetical protein
MERCGRRIQRERERQTDRQTETETQRERVEITTVSPRRSSSEHEVADENIK